MIRLGTELDMPAVRDLWYAAFHDTKEYMDVWFSEFYPRAKTLLFEEEGTARGALQMLPVTLISEGLEHHGYYIGGVSVWEAFRHEKIGSRLMEEAKSAARDDGMDFCILVSDVVGYYERFGYAALSHRAVLKAQPCENTEFTFSPVQRSDGERALDVYRSYAKTAFQVRSAKQMVDMMRLESASNGGGVLIQKEQRTLAYVAYDAWEDTLFVDEAAWTGEDGKRGVLTFLHSFGKENISIRCGEDFSEKLGNPSVMIQKINEFALPSGGYYNIVV